MDVEKFDTVVLDLSWYWYWSRVKVTLAKSQLGCGCAAVEQWYFSEASGLVLELLEAEPAGTARHRTRQPGEISRPFSRQKHGRIPSSSYYSRPSFRQKAVQSLRLPQDKRHWILFEAFQGLLPGKTTAPAQDKVNLKTLDHLLFGSILNFGLPLL